MERFYRVGHKETSQGLWYDPEGIFTGFIHDKFNFCTNNTLEMPFDSEICGYLSATRTLDELFQWFPVEDIIELQKHGYCIIVYESDEFRYYKNHWIISQGSNKLWTLHFGE